MGIANHVPSPSHFVQKGEKCINGELRSSVFHHVLTVFECAYFFLHQHFPVHPFISFFFWSFYPSLIVLMSCDFPSFCLFFVCLISAYIGADYLKMSNMTYRYHTQNRLSECKVTHVKHFSLHFFSLPHFPLIPTKIGCRSVLIWSAGKNNVKYKQ